MRTYACPKGRERGFSLIELMFATGYFMAGLVGLVAFQVIAARGAQRAADITLATTLTANAIEAVRVTSPTSLVQGQPVLASFDRYGYENQAPTYFTVSTTVTQPVGTQYLDVVAMTTWKLRPADLTPHDVTFQTRIALP